MDRLASMAVFVKAAEAGSFAAAAAATGMTAQMVGKHVRFLEEQLAARLLNRTTRRQSLTELGRVYYERCKSVLAEAEAAHAIVEDLRGRPRGLLRVNAPINFGTYSLTPMLTRYMRTYPEIRVDLTLTDRFVDLVEEGYDAVIRLAALADSTLIARALRPYRLVVCASPAYLAEHGTPTQPEDLTRHECLGFAYWARAPISEWHFTGPGGERAVRVGTRFAINNGQALRAAAIEGFGIILQAEDMLADDLASGRLVRLLPDYAAPSRPMHILFAPGRPPTPKLRSFIDFVVASFG